MRTVFDAPWARVDFVLALGGVHTDYTQRARSRRGLTTTVACSHVSILTEYNMSEI